MNARGTDGAVEPQPPRLRSRWRAAVATALVLAVAALTVVLATDRPLFDAPSRTGVADRAAFAVRDRVPAFQQWGSRAFTVPSLQAAYGEVEYLTIRGANEDHREDFVQRLQRLLESHASVDLFVLAHSNHVIDWVAPLDAALRRRLRLVYNTGCFDARQRERWLELGARSYVGHVGLSESPIFYVFFLRRWLRGQPLADAVAEGNRRTGRALGLVSPGLLFNRRATAASTFAEITGDAGLRIDEARP